jgi:hypothetical protein
MTARPVEGGGRVHTAIFSQPVEAGRYASTLWLDAPDDIVQAGDGYIWAIEPVGDRARGDKVLKPPAKGRLEVGMDELRQA